MKAFARSGLVLVGCLSLAACSTASEDDTKSGEAAVVADAKAMVQRPDGKWDAVCKNGTTEVVTTEQILANKVCLPAGGAATTCVKNCAERYSNGTCRSYGPDYCAAGAVCIPAVSERYSTGEPRSYGPDLCGSGGAACVKNCTERYSNGTCRTYGLDVCAVGAAAPACVTHCTERDSNGTCRTYGADLCGTSGTQCIENCTERYSNGTCRTYGPDLCK